MADDGAPRKGSSGVTLYVLVRKGICTGPPARFVFEDREMAREEARDPDDENWPSEYRVVRTTVQGDYRRGDPVYAAHWRHDEEEVDGWWDVYRFICLHATHEGAEEIAGHLGAVNRLVPIPRRGDPVPAVRRLPRA